MPNQEGTSRGRFRRAVSLIASKFHFGRRRSHGEEEAPHPPLATVGAPSPRKRGEGSSSEITPRPIQTDVPIDLIAKEYVPHQTASKGSFRSDSIDRFSEQDIVHEDDRFKPEDLMTNHSGDPRIGTHGRTHTAVDRDRDEAR